MRIVDLIQDLGEFFRRRIVIGIEFVQSSIGFPTLIIGLFGFVDDVSC